MEIRTKTGHFVWDPIGIVRITMFDNLEVGLEEAMENGKACVELSNNTPHIVVCNLGQMVSSTKEARDYAKSKNLVDITLALAMITNTKFGRLVGNLFMRFTNPPYPVKMFSSEEECEKWVLSFLEAKGK